MPQDLEQTLLLVSDLTFQNFIILKLYLYLGSDWFTIFGLVYGLYFKNYITCIGLGRALHYIFSLDKINCLPLLDLGTEKAETIE
jgi:hypothetical protein